MPRRALSSLCPGLVALLSAASPACAPAAAPAAAPLVVIPRAEKAAPEVEAGTQGADVLVWVDEAEGKPRTIRLAASPEGYRQVAEAPALLVSDGSAVWRWTETAETLATEGCEYLSTPPGEGAGVRIEAARLGSDERVTVVSPPTDRGMNEINHSAIPLASVGPYLFVREFTYLYGCGAHGMSGTSLVVWDLAARKPAEILRPEEQSAVETTERAEAQQLFAGDGEEPPAAEDVSFIAALPRYSGAGWLRVDHAFRTWACYACGDNAWGSYSRAVNVPARRLPERLRPYVRAPGVVSAFLRDNPDTAIQGWSVVPDAALPALERELAGG
jgi:hypothetical protein